MEGSVPVQLKFDSIDLPVKSVTVYNDRAEVTRTISLKLASGTNEVLVQNVASTIDADSIRVDGRGGDALIHEVLFVNQNNRIPAADFNSQAIDDLVKEKEKVCAEGRDLEDRQKIWNCRLEVLDNVFKQIGNPGSLNKEDATPLTLFTEDLIDKLDKYGDLYEDRSITLRRKISEGAQETIRLRERLNKLERELDRLRTGGDGNSKNISIMLSSEQGGEAELRITYQVYQASWKPTYDIRMQMAKNQNEKSSLTINYYALIRQSTGEDWNNASLNLSTVQPSRGGTVPELVTLNASIYKSVTGGLFGLAVQKTPAQSYTLFGQAAGATTATFGGTPPPAAATTVTLTAMEHAVADPVEAENLSASFSITRPSTIPSDGNEQRVTIGVIQLDPRFMHEIVPSKSLNAFLTATATNTSQLAFLPGPAAIYMNNSFVAKTTIKAISPGEGFTCSLGVDTSVKVECKPAQKFHEEVGLLAKWSMVVHEQHILVKNTKSSENVTVTLKEPIPRSSDEKIRVKLLKPDLGQQPTTASTDNGEGARLDASNILIWTVNIEPSKSMEMIVKWSLEHPTGEKIIYN